MSTPLFLQGLIIGFSIAAPVGPIGILCIRRTLTEGRASGFFSGMGAATADAFYGCVAGFGLTVISAFLIEQRFWLQVVGGIFLCYLGARTLRSQPDTEAAPGGEKGLLSSYVSTFFLTITNPMTILSFAAIFAGLGVVAAGGDLAAACWLVVGVFLGSAAWWLFLSMGVSLLREKVNSTALRWVNRLSGVILLSFGALALWQSAV